MEVKRMKKKGLSSAFTHTKEKNEHAHGYNSDLMGRIEIVR